MSPKEKILVYIQRKKMVSGGELTEEFGISRQAMHKHLKQLIQKGLVAKIGSTRGAVYTVSKGQAPIRFRKTYPGKGLEEDTVFRDIDLMMSLRKNLKKNVYDIVHYAFTEILNNAIEHSFSKTCSVEATLDHYMCSFTIRDYGIGIFASIFKKFNLPDEISAIGELIKGKTTTMKERHSGEGVFFTSKSGDTVLFRSHRITITFDNMKKDIFVDEKKFIRGTNVIFSVSKQSKRNLTDILKQYAPEEFENRFEKTRVFVKLFQQEYFSRSEARRMLAGLDRFKEIVLDFTGVTGIGQGFADEVFRVFKKQNPAIEITTENLSPAVEQMIRHVVDNINQFKVDN